MLVAGCERMCVSWTAQTRQGATGTLLTTCSSLLLCPPLQVPQALALKPTFVGSTRKAALTLTNVTPARALLMCDLTQQPDLQLLLPPEAWSQQDYEACPLQAIGAVAGLGVGGLGSKAASKIGSRVGSRVGSRMGSRRVSRSGNDSFGSKGYGDMPQGSRWAGWLRQWCYRLMPGPLSGSVAPQHAMLHPPHAAATDCHQRTGSTALYIEPAGCVPPLPRRYLITVAPNKSLELQLQYRPSKPGSLALSIPFVLQQQLAAGISAHTQEPRPASATPDAAAAAPAAAWTGGSVMVSCDARQPLLGLSEPLVDFGSVYVLRANQFKTPYVRTITITNLDAQEQQVGTGEGGSAVQSLCQAVAGSKCSLRAARKRPSRSCARPQCPMQGALAAQHRHQVH